MNIVDYEASVVSGKFSCGLPDFLEWISLCFSPSGDFAGFAALGGVGKCGFVLVMSTLIHS